MRLNNFVTSMLLVGASCSGLAQASGFDPFVVEDIRVDGLQRVALGAALLNLPIQVGDTMDTARLQQAMKRLYGSANFDDIQVYRDGNTLVVKVIERPTISRITLEGNKDLKDEQLEESLQSSGVRVGEALDRTMLTEIEKGLQDFYFSVGKYNAEVKARVINLARNRVELKFEFKEGDGAEVAQINLVGNQVFSESDLLSVFDLKDTKPWWNPLADKRYQKLMLEGDLEKLTSYYQQRGYLRFRISSTQVSITPDKQALYVTVNLDEGEQYHLDEINLTGDLLDKRELIERLVQLEPGELYNSADVTFSEQMITQLLARYGYAYPTVTTYPEINDQNKTVSLNINVDPGKRIYVRNINFNGNTLTKDEVLRREVRQMEGSWLNSGNIEQSTNRLNRLGFFEQVNSQVSPVPGSDDLVDLTFDVKEQPSGSFTFGIGYGTESKLSFQLGLSQSNFMGSGNSVGVSVDTNKHSKSVNLSYRDPYFTKHGVSAGGNVYWSAFDADEYYLESYQNDSYGVGFDLSWPVNEYNRLGVGIGYRHNELSDVSPYQQVLKFYNIYADINDPTNSLEFDNFEASANWNRNTLNRGTFPSAGSSQRLSGSMTVPGSDIQYFKLNFDTSHYFPVDYEQKFVFLARGRVGYGNGYGTFEGHDQILPFWENFYAGGSTALRGFRTNSIGPKSFYLSGNGTPCVPDPSGGIGNCSLPGDPDTITVDGGRSIGGNTIATVTAEFIVPTPFLSGDFSNSVRTSFFVDAGQVWDTEFDYDSYRFLPESEFNKLLDYSDPSRIRASYGASFQWLSPMGPMVFSLAWPLKEYEGDRTEIFTFNIGRTF